MPKLHRNTDLARARVAHPWLEFLDRPDDLGSPVTMRRDPYGYALVVYPTASGWLESAYYNERECHWERCYSTPAGLGTGTRWDIVWARTLDRLAVECGDAYPSLHAAAQAFEKDLDR